MTEQPNTNQGDMSEEQSELKKMHDVYNRFALAVMAEPQLRERVALRWAESLIETIQMSLTRDGVEIGTEIDSQWQSVVEKVLENDSLTRAFMQIYLADFWNDYDMPDFNYRGPVFSWRDVESAKLAGRDPLVDLKTYGVDYVSPGDGQ